jgi:hypothetical protein
MSIDEREIRHLLAYAGRSFRQEQPVADGIALFDYRNTDDNDRKISTLLSSQSIPFHIERRGQGWTGPRVRMVVTVPVEHHRQADDMLRAAAKASILEIVEGTEGLIYR